MLEREKSQLIKMKDDTSVLNPQEKNKFVNRIDNLETELKDYRKKVK